MTMTRQNVFRRMVAWWAVAAGFVLAAAALAQQSPPGGVRMPRPASLPVLTEPQEFQTIEGPIRVVPFVRGLTNPWSLAFLPNGDILVTEKPGRLRIVRKGVLDPQSISGVPQVFAEGQGGLLEVAPHPRFAENRLIYLTYSKGTAERNTTALARGRLESSAIVGLQDVFVADAWRNVTLHFGSRIAFARDGTLFMTVGERNDRTRAQDTTHHAGKVLRLRDDGTVPPDNPFVGRAGFRAEIYSYGHRNPQGLAVHPETGQAWATEHGPQGGDELNLIQPGKNYGWPIVTYGREYTGEIISSQPWRQDMEQPVVFWVPSIALSGMTFYNGDRFPRWKGNLFVGGLSGLQIQRVAFTDRGPIGRETLLESLKLRIRDVRQGQDGYLYLLVDDAQGAILRIEPGATARETARR
jgi:glucose/arabinose dehydrogenase